VGINISIMLVDDVSTVNARLANCNKYTFVNNSLSDLLYV
jgi:hypothetical protein